MTELPRVPTGDSPLHQFARQLRQCVLERTILEHPTVALEKTDKGVRVKAKPQIVTQQSEATP